MIKLKNVSKYYYSRGMIASGISNVSLHFDIGEFVVITGESGSGKTTLLNVISGLDSYEEGEMYAGGVETSHYAASDFEEYRKKYIGNIFQDFNLINSYTVYQNVELALLINGCTGEEIRNRVPQIIEKVGLTSHAKTRVSKLSGGQKQRAAIARALAKDTDIIVADEPTGNLDSASAEGIVQLLSEISKDKLVIVVTHNYSQFAAYATRTIRMHDGKVAEDKRVKSADTTTLFYDMAAAGGVIPEEHGKEAAEADAEKSSAAKGDISAGGKLKLGIRNTFNIPSKFALLLGVFLFVVFAVTSQYTTFLHQAAEEEKLGFNNYFYNYSEDRVILKKTDGTPFTEDDLKVLRNTANVRSVVINDIVLDTALYIEDGDFAYETFPHVLGEFEGERALYAGRMPEAENEAVLTAYRDDYYLGEDMIDGTLGDVLDKTYRIALGEDKELPVTVVGFAYKEEDDGMMYAGDLFVTDQLMSTMLTELYNYNSSIRTTINGKEQEYQPGNPFYRIVPNSNVAQGTVLIFEEANNFFENSQAKGQTINITAENLYYTQAVDLQIADIYNKKNFTSLTGVDDFDMHNGTIYVNQADYDTLFRKGNYQATVYAADVKAMDGMLAALENMGYVTLPLKETLIAFADSLSSVVQVPVTVILIAAIFLIAYFVIRLILKSRAAYFSILRMLGMAKKNIRRILDVEMLVVVNIAYGIFLGCVALVRSGYVHVAYLMELVGYMQIRDYVILYGVVLVMAYFLSGKFAKNLFKKTAMKTFREEAD